MKEHEEIVQEPKRLSTAEETELERSSFQSLHNLFSVESEEDTGVVQARIGGVEVRILIDSGAQVNAITEESFKFLCEKESTMFNVILEPVTVLRSYASAGQLSVSTSFEAKMSIPLSDGDTTEFTEEFFVVRKAKRNLLSKETGIRHRVLALGESARAIGQVNTLTDESVQEIFPVFDIEPVKINIDKSVTPKKVRYTCIPLHWRKEVNRQLKDLEERGIIEKVSDWNKIKWVSSMLAVPKANGKLRVVVDLREPNRAVIRDVFVMPTLDSVLSTLAGCKVFSTIDLSDAFYHIPLHEESKYITTFWTGEEYFRFNRLPFGLTCAPDIFQGVLQEVVLKGCKNQLNYMDDILVATAEKKAHEEALREVLKKLTEHNVKINNEKSKFGEAKVTFLGFSVGESGLSITEDRFESLRKLKEPGSVAEVRSFLGMLTFIERFIINRAEKTAELRKIANSKKFEWNESARSEFENIRDNELRKISSLDFFDQQRATTLYVDASPCGLGAVLTQSGDKSEEEHIANQGRRIICCASRALTPVERRYPQQHREALAIVWGIEKFKFYLLGEFKVN